jgi:AcrR family transcriptional regulator
MSQQALVWRGTTAQGRAAARRARLIAVGVELIGERGTGGVTVREVYARARLNPRYFYESFPDLDAFLGAVYDELLAELISRVLAAISDAAPTEPAKTRAAIDTAIRFLTEDPRRIKVLLSDAGAGGPLAARRGALVRVAAAAMADQAAAFYGMPADARLLRSTTVMLAGGLLELVLAWSGGGLELTVEELIDDAAALVSGMGEAARGVARRRGARRR